MMAMPWPQPVTSTHCAMLSATSTCSRSLNLYTHSHYSVSQSVSQSVRRFLLTEVTRALWPLYPNRNIMNDRLSCLIRIVFYKDSFQDNSKCKTFLTSCSINIACSWWILCHRYLHTRAQAHTALSKSADCIIKVQKSKTKEHIMVLCESTHRYRKSHAIWDHAATKQNLVLDLATPERCKAELTWLVIISQDNLPAKDDQLSQK